MNSLCAVTNLQTDQQRDGQDLAIRYAPRGPTTLGRKWEHYPGVPDGQCRI